jgi:hypothetical protein
LLILALAGPGWSADVTKPKPKHKALPAAAAPVARPAKGSETLRLRDVLAPPGFPQGPAPPMAPQPPSGVTPLKAFSDPAQTCRQTCSSQLYQCRTEENPNCDTSWTLCIARCRSTSFH